MWIRVETDVGRNVDVQRCRAELNAARRNGDGTAPESRATRALVSTPEIVGLLTLLWGQIAEQSSEGSVADVPDDALEEWAVWSGEPGLFARAFRAHLVTDGRVKSWDTYQGALIRKQQADRERKRDRKPRDLPPERRRNPDGIPRAGSAPVARNENDNEHERVVGVIAPRDPGALAVELTVQANKGMQDNPKIGNAYNPIIATSGTSFSAAEQVIAAGVPPEPAKRTVYETARAYEPKRAGDHPKSLGYFVPAITAAWEADSARTAAGEAVPARGAAIPPRGDAARGRVERTAQAAGAAFDGLNGAGAAP